MVQVGQRTTNTLRRELFAKMQSLPLRYFDSHTHGDLMSRYTNDIDALQMALEQSLVQLISSAVNFVGAAVMMLVLSPVLSIVTAVVIAIMVIIMRELATRSRKNFMAQQRDLGKRERLRGGNGGGPEGHQGVRPRERRHCRVPEAQRVLPAGCHRARTSMPRWSFPSWAT